MQTKTSSIDKSLDPVDWQEFEDIAHQALQDAIEMIKNVRDRPVWQPVPAETKARLQIGGPYESTSLESVYKQALNDVMSYPTGNIHPRFWGWVMGTGTADGLIADLIISAMNSHLAGYDQSASIIEHQVLSWFLDLFGYPVDQGSGIFVSGGTAANITGVVAAREAGADFDVREEGLNGRPQLTIYGSTETHSWIKKCCELLGLGRQAFRKIPVDDQYRIRLSDLKETIAADRKKGFKPFCVIGNAGTVNTGAIDDLDALADICAAENLWLHIDGALGGLAVLSKQHRTLLKGIERSDSVAFDLHKWGYLQYEIGCLIVRDKDLHEQAFKSTANYLEPVGRGIQPGTLEFAQRGIQLSRGFRAFKAWFALKTHGVDKIGEIISQNIDHISYLATLVTNNENLELVAPAPLSVVCFRFVTPGASMEEMNRINREILWRIQEEGIAVPSSTVLDGRFVIRVANSNHRTRQSDFDILIDAVVRIGKEIAEAN